MCNDDSYMLNHLLFDDWFVSSIATDTQDYNQDQSAQSTMFTKTTSSSPLRCPTASISRPRGADSRTCEPGGHECLSATKDSKTGLFAFESIASKLEVDGMFNINSVSLDAWKALLRQSRDAEVPYLYANGNTNDRQRRFLFLSAHLDRR